MDFLGRHQAPQGGGFDPSMLLASGLSGTNRGRSVATNSPKHSLHADSGYGFESPQHLYDNHQPWELDPGAVDILTAPKVENPYCQLEQNEYGAGKLSFLNQPQSTSWMSQTHNSEQGPVDEFHSDDTFSFNGSHPSPPNANANGLTQHAPGDYVEESYENSSFENYAGEEDSTMTREKKGKRKCDMSEKQLHSQRVFERQSRARLSDTFRELANALPVIKIANKKCSPNSKNAIAATAVDFIQECKEERETLKAERERLLRELTELKYINQVLRAARVTFFVNTVEILDVRGSYVYFDDKFAKFMALPPNVIARQSMFNIFGQEGQVCPQNKIVKVFQDLQTTGQWRGRCELLIPGHPAYLQTHETLAVPIADESGQMSQIAFFRKVPSCLIEEINDEELDMPPTPDYSDDYTYQNGRCG
eukprot:Colp12_sorted_trinity150504_noHs@3418